jgi:hypothetical protein
MMTIELKERLLPNIGRIAAPEHTLLKSFFPMIDNDLREVGLHLRVSEDIDALEEVCRRTGKFLPNAFQKSKAPLPDGDAVWFALHSDSGELVATIAHRIYRLPHHTLADWLTTGALFYKSPIEQMPEGERFYLDKEADAFASKIRGSVTMAGSLWVSDRYKGRTNLARFLTLFGASFAYAKWNAMPIISIVEDEVMQKMSVKYSFTHNVEGVYWYRPHKPHRTKMWLLAKTQATIVSDTETYMNAPQEQRLWVNHPEPVEAQPNIAIAGTG